MNLHKVKGGQQREMATSRLEVVVSMCSYSGQENIKIANLSQGLSDNGLSEPDQNDP